MNLVSAWVGDEFVNPLFECFDGGDFILSSWRDIEGERTQMQIFFPEAANTARAVKALEDTARVVGVTLKIETSTIPDTDWTLAYRLHFKAEAISAQLVVCPEWERDKLKIEDGKLKIGDQISTFNFQLLADAKVLVMDPGMAFGTGQHATTRACLEFIDALAVENNARTFLDVGCGSGILAVAARLLGFRNVAGFDIDPDAVEVANETAAMNGMEPFFTRGDLCGLSTLPGVDAGAQRYEVVAANVLGPVLIRFADEITSRVERVSSARLILSGILDELYPEVRAAYEQRGFEEVSSKLIGEWRTGLFKWKA